MADEVIQSLDPEESLYTILQKKSLDYIQRMSGKVWTDYNVHDPGVTILDLLNYVLWDLDYQLSFKLEDYLTPENGSFRPEKNGLFGPQQVFPVSPVSPDDYRKLIFDSFDDIENVEISAYNPDLLKDRYACYGMYDLNIQICFWSSNAIRKKYLRKEIGLLFQRHRNLCESLHDIHFVDWCKKEITATLEITSEVPPAVILASVYIEASKLYANGIRYSDLESLQKDGYPVEDILDGPQLEYLAVDNNSLANTIPEAVQYMLFCRLKEIAGIRAVSGLVKDDKEMYTLMGDHIAVSFPQRKSDVHIRLQSGGKNVDFDFEELSRLLYRYRTNQYGDHRRTYNKNKNHFPPPDGTFRDIYTYYSVQNDFPHNYGINSWGVAPDETDRRKAQARQLKGFMIIFDLLFAKGLHEAEDMQAWMTLTDRLPADEIPILKDDPLLQWDVLTDDGKREEVGKQHIYTLRQEKQKWLDVLDKLYGEQSNPRFLLELDFYNETEEEQTARRIRFLCGVPGWGFNRFRGINIYDTSEKGRSGIDLYLSTLLGFKGANNHPVTNLFASYNLNLLPDSLFFSKWGWLLDSRLIIQNREDIQKDNRLLNIPDMQLREWSDHYYVWLRKRIPLLQHGFMFETFLHKGFLIDNYKILVMPEMAGMPETYLLLFRYGAGLNWSSLGRFNSKEELIKTANYLCSFLLMLNRGSETMYVVEHSLLIPRKEEEQIEDTEEWEEDYAEEFSSDVPESDECMLPIDFSMTIVLTGFTARTAHTQFREQVESLISDRTPVHLDAYTVWLPMGRLAFFEKLYYSWREALASQVPAKINETSGRLSAFLLKIRREYDNGR